MRSSLHVLSGLLATLAPSVFAQADASALDRNIAVFNERWMVIEHADRNKLDALRTTLVKNLQALEKQVQEEGDLDGVLACREEIARVNGGGDEIPAEVLATPREIPLDEFSSGSKKDAGILGIMGSPMPSPTLDLDLEAGVHRFILMAAQDKAGDEDALMVFSVGEVLEESVRVPQPRNAPPGRYEFQATFPAGQHRVTIGFPNDFYQRDPPQDRNLLIKSFTHVPPPVRGAGLSEHPKVAALQAAWTLEMEAARKACLPPRGDLVKKYLEALNALAATMNRSSQAGELEKVRKEMDRAKTHLPAELVSSLQLDSIGTDPRPPPGRLNLLYPFDEVSANLTPPAGGAGPALRMHGETKLLAVPNCGRIVQLASTNDYLVATSAEGTDLDKKSLTLAYYCQDLAPGPYTLLYKGSEKDPARLEFGYIQGSLFFRVGPDTLRYTPTQDREAWKHIVLVYNRATHRQTLYLDGKEAASGPVAGEMAGSDGQPLTIGRNPVQNQSGFRGRLNQLRILDRALAPHEVTALYNQEKVAHDWLLRSWFGSPPRSARDLEALLENTHWVLKIEAGRSPEETRVLQFRPGGTLTLEKSKDPYNWKATSARVIEVWHVEHDRRENIYKFEFSAAYDRFDGQHLRPSESYGKRRWGFFLNRQ